MYGYQNNTLTKEIKPMQTKKTYSTPKLAVHGNVEEITFGPRSRGTSSDFPRRGFARPDRGGS